MLAATDTNLLIALIGLPAAMVAAIGTVYGMGRLKRRNGNGQATGDHVTGPELRGAIRELRDELRGEVDHLRIDMNARLDLIVKIVDGRRV